MDTYVIAFGGELGLVTTSMTSIPISWASKVFGHLPISSHPCPKNATLLQRRRYGGGHAVHSSKGKRHLAWQWKLKIVLFI